MDYVVRDSDIGCFRVLEERSRNELQKAGCDVVWVWAFSMPKPRDELVSGFGFKASS